MAGSGDLGVYIGLPDPRWSSLCYWPLLLPDTAQPRTSRHDPDRHIPAGVEVLVGQHVGGEGLWVELVVQGP